MAKAIKRVKDSQSKTVGFMVDFGRRVQFVNNYNINKMIDSIGNLSVLKNGVFRAKQELDVIALKELNEQTYKEISIKNPIKRDVQDRLVKWKNNTSHVVLKLQGSRQIGKTTELLKFAYSNYEYIIYVNMADDKQGFSGISKEIFTDIFLEGYCNRSNIPDYTYDDRTILVIDEIQNSSDIYNSIREFRRELGFDVIVTGSYLGETLKKEFFQPAGDIECIDMYSLSFSEFCKVFKADNILMDIRLDGKSDGRDYDRLYELYDIYRQIGGYPAVVMEYLKSRSIENCLYDISKLISIFSKESATYFKRNEEKLIFDSVYNYIVTGMVSNKKGSISLIGDMHKEIVDSNKKKLVTRKELSMATAWLESCGIVGICVGFDMVNKYNVVQAKKLYFRDCGVANYLGSMSSIVNEGDLKGMLTENFAYCEFMRLYSTGDIRKRKVKGWYPGFAVYGDYELDFLITSMSGNTYGIEVKTSKGIPKSLQKIIDKGLIDKAVVDKRTKGGNTGGILTIPIFTVGCRFPYE